MRGPLIKLIIFTSSLLPLPVSHGLGALLGTLLYLIPNRHRRITAINIDLCFPDYDSRQRKRLLRDTLIELGKSIFEVGALWCWPKDKVLGLIKEVSGRDLLDRAFAGGKGVILALPHLGAWEIIGMYGSANHPMTSLYHPPTIATIDSVMRKARERLGATLVPTDNRGVRALFKALQQNHLVAILPDQDPGESGNVFAPFYGIPANTMTLITRLAQKTGAEVLFCFAERLKQGKGFHLHFINASDAIKHDDPVTAASALNSGIEQCIAQCPAQYQWCYKRFKKRPDDAKGFY